MKYIFGVFALLFHLSNESPYYYRDLVEIY